MLLKKPNEDDTLIRNILNQSIVSQAILVAYDIGLFKAVGHDKKTLTELCRIVSIPKKSLFSLLTLCICHNLITLESDTYQLTAYAKEYLLEESPFYFGDLLNLVIQQNSTRAYPAIKFSLMEGQPQVYEKQGLFEVHETNHALLENFVKAMHAKSISPGALWPEFINVNKDDVMLDIGGAAGTHTISACMRWKDLTGIIYERPNVCEIAERYIKHYQLENRISTYHADMWHDPFPPAQIHFYSDIFHDWPEKEAYYLAKKSFSTLPSQGRIIIHEMLFDEKKTGPFNVAAYNLNMLIWTRGQQFSGEEFRTILTESGFRNVEIQRTFGDWHIVIGHKS
jgi:O-methyltransferase domain